MRGFTFDEFGLTQRERQVLEGLAGGVKQVEIAEMMGVSAMRVSQLKKSLIRKGMVGEDGLLTERGREAL